MKFLNTAVLITLVVWKRSFSTWFCFLVRSAWISKKKDNLHNYSTIKTATTQTVAISFIVHNSSHLARFLLAVVMVLYDSITTKNFWPTLTTFVMKVCSKTRIKMYLFYSVFFDAKIIVIEKCRNYFLLYK